MDMTEDLGFISESVLFDSYLLAVLNNNALGGTGYALSGEIVYITSDIVRLTSDILDSRRLVNRSAAAG